MNQKVKDFINNKGYTQYKISNPNKDCAYNDSNRDILKQSKAQIIKTIFRYNKKIESIISNLQISNNDIIEEYLEQKEIDHKSEEKKPYDECVKIKNKCPKKESRIIKKSPINILYYDEEFKKIDSSSGKKVNHKAHEQIFNLINSFFGKGIGLLILYSPKISLIILVTYII